MHINELIRKNEKELEKRGVKEVAPGVYLSPFINTKKNWKSWEKFNEEYGAAVDKAIARKDALIMRKANKKFWDFVITY